MPDDPKESLQSRALRMKVEKHLRRKRVTTAQLARSSGASEKDLNALRAKKLSPAKLESLAEKLVCDLGFDSAADLLRYRVFVAWDMSQETIPATLEWARDEADQPWRVTVPLGEHDQGRIWDGVKDGILASDRLIAFVDRPNANVAFEVGFALSVGVPVVFVAAEGVKRTFKWERHTPFQGFFVTPCRDIEMFQDIVESPKELAPLLPIANRGRDVATLCADVDDGRAVRATLGKLGLPWSRLIDLPTVKPPRDPAAAGGSGRIPLKTVDDLPQALAGVGRVIWPLVRTPEDRDGAEQTSLGVIAGYGIGQGIELRVALLGEARRLADVEHLRPAELKRLRDLEPHLRSLPPVPEPQDETAPNPPGTPASPEPRWTPEAALTTYRAHLRTIHAHVGGRFHLAVEKVVPLLTQRRCEPQDGKAGDARDERSLMEALRVEKHERAFVFGASPMTLDGLLKQAPADRPFRLALIGRAGAGKSTLCRRLVHDYAGVTEGPLALFLPLVRWQEAAARSGGTPPDAFDLLSRDLSRVHGDGASTALAEALRTLLSRPGQLILLLDGFDELRDDRSDMRDTILGLASAHEHLRIVFTSRPAGFDPKDFEPTFTSFEVRPLGESEQKELLTHHLGERAAAVWDQIQQRPALRVPEVAGSPLLLTMLADLVLRGRDLPRRRVELFREAITTFLERGHGDPPKSVADPLAARRALMILALELQTSGGEAWSQDALYEAYEQALDSDPKIRTQMETHLKPWGQSFTTFLHDIGMTSGVLAPAGDEHAPWSFVHRSFREMLAAEELHRRGRPVWGAKIPAKAKSDDAREQAHRWGAQWGGTYGLLAGLVAASDSKPLLEALRSADGDLALTVLPDAQGWSLESTLDFFLTVPDRDGDRLARLLALWPDSPEHEALAKSVLDWVIARDGTSPEAVEVEDLAFVLYALEKLVGSCSSARDRLRDRFFDSVPRFAGRQRPTIDTRPIPPTGRQFTFMMGSPEGEGGGNERPQRRVTLSPFRLGRTPVTVGEYQSFVGARKRRGTEADVLPVTQVSWWEA